MKFIDEVEIDVAAGHGGSGCRHFRREKYVPLGGPDGGNGGHGGSVKVIADKNVLTLLDLRQHPRWHASDGEPGEGSRKDGKHGSDLIIRVPVGTEIIDVTNDKLLFDLAADGSEVIVAKGGRGGKGNEFFKSATNRAPEQFQPGEPGEQRRIRLSLKLVADVGLVGLPNAGKSTLISRITAAKPKIADYPFTTLVPNLGVVRAREGKSFVVADIPGLIPGAHEGRGLGIKFLKHIERTRVLLHLIDINQFFDDGGERGVYDAYCDIRHELESFSPELAKKPEIIVLTKIDTVGKERVEVAEAELQSKNLECLSISSVSGYGIQTVLDRTLQLLSETA